MYCKSTILAFMCLVMLVQTQTANSCNLSTNPASSISFQISGAAKHVHLFLLNFGYIRFPASASALSIYTVFLQLRAEDQSHTTMQLTIISATRSAVLEENK